MGALAVVLALFTTQNYGFLRLVYTTPVLRSCYTCVQRLPYEELPQIYTVELSIEP